MAATAEFSFLSSLPAGFVFRPTEEQLITHYLNNKNVGNESVVGFIKEIDLYKFEPEQLPDKSFVTSDNFEWFFFRANTSNTKRTTTTGCWKSTGEPRPIKAGGTNEVIGSRQIFVFHRGLGAKGVKTNWVIHEYKLHPDTKIPSLLPFVIFRLKNENADGQSSSVASQTKKTKITQVGATQKPGAGTSENPDNLTQNPSDFSLYDQFMKSVSGDAINSDVMTSNNHVGRYSEEELDDTDSEHEFDGFISDTNTNDRNRLRKLRREYKTVQFLTCRVSGSSGISMGSDNTDSSKVVPKGSKPQRGSCQPNSNKVVPKGSKPQKVPLSRETQTTKMSGYKAQGYNTHTQIVNPPQPSTQRILHNSRQHPLVYFAKALLGIGMLVMFARDMVLYRLRR